MAIPISSFLSKASAAIPFLVRDTDIRGGFRTVSNTAALEAVPIGARTEGMLVFVADADEIKKWTSGAWQTVDLTKYVNLGEGLRIEDGAIRIDSEFFDEHYAAADHSHDEYAAANHTHEEYAEVNHTHDEYAAANHTHDEYAAANHSHDEYAATEHTHDEYAAANHSHEEYAATEHTHTFESLDGIPKVSAMPGVTISTEEPGPDDGEDGDIWFVVA